MQTNALQTLSNWLQNPQLMPLIILMIAAVLLTTSMRRRRRPPPTPPPPRARSEADTTSFALRRDLDALMVELQELSRRISAEIDTRFAKLEAAMKDADRRIAVLNRLSREPTGLPEPGNPASASRGAGETASTPDVRHVVVHELSDAGFTPVEIARELGRTPGEVELILNLRRQSPSKS